MLIRTTLLISASIFMCLGLVACEGSDSEPTVNESANTPDDVESNDNETPEPFAIDAHNVNMVESVVDSAGFTLDGSWLSNCVNTYTNSTQHALELITIEGARYERMISLYEDSDCTMPSEFSYINVSSSDFMISDSTVQTSLGTAIRMVLGVFAVNGDGLSGEDLKLFDPGITFYDFFMPVKDDRLFFGSTLLSLSDTEVLPLDETRFYTKQ